MTTAGAAAAAPRTPPRAPRRRRPNPTPTDNEQRSASRTQPLRLRPGGDDRVGDEQVVDPAVGEDLRLADRRDGQPDRPGRDLPPPELEALVRLGVRPQRDPALAHDGGHRGDPGVGAVEVDDDRRRVERGGGVGIEEGVGHRVTSAARWRSRSWEDTARGAPAARGSGPERKEGVGQTMTISPPSGPCARVDRG